jgi:hypothetical protein
VLVNEERFWSGGEYVCQRCAAQGLPGQTGADLPAYAVEWSHSSGERLNSAVCLREARAWDIEESYGARSGQQEIANLAHNRSQWMYQAYKAFLTAQADPLLEQAGLSGAQGE